MDVGLLYNPRYFKLENVTNHRLHAVPFRTRDQMCVVGSLLGQRIAVIVNHWPSRLGGQERSEPNRRAAAALSKAIADSLWKVDPEIGVIVMGDMNDDPQDASCAQVLGGKRNIKDAKPHGFYNPFWEMHSRLQELVEPLRPDNHLRQSGHRARKPLALHARHRAQPRFP